MSNTNTNLPTQTSTVLHNDTISSCLTSKVQDKSQLSKERCMQSLKAIQSQFKFLTDTLHDFVRMQKYTRFDAQFLYDAMICNMDSIGKYMLEITLHQQRTLQLLKEKKLMQTQEDHSNPIQALNIDLLKVDLVVIQNTCSEKEDNHSETASSKLVNENSLDSATKDVHAIKYKMSKAKERCMAYFRSLHSHLLVLSKEDVKGTRIEHGFKRAFMSLFGQDADTFTNYDSQMTDKYFVEYTGIEVKHFRDTLLQHMGNVKKLVAERTQVQDDSIRSWNDIDVDDADIFAIGQQNTKQPKIINEGRVNRYPEQCQVKSTMLDSSLDNQTTEYSKQ
ncbi:hypothetical protein Tco_1244490 [Tanacetum coccineum]